MRDKNRIEPFLKEIGECWNEVPGWRFGQLISNVLLINHADPFFIEDDDTLEIFKKYFRKKMKKKN